MTRPVIATAAEQHERRGNGEAGVAEQAPRPPPTKKNSTTDPTARKVPSPTQPERCRSGLRRNQPRCTTSSYMRRSTASSVGLKRFFSCDSATRSPAANTESRSTCS